MKAWFCLVLISLSSLVLSRPAEAAGLDGQPIVRVRVLKDREKIELKVREASISDLGGQNRFVLKGKEWAQVRLQRGNWKESSVVLFQGGRRLPANVNEWVFPLRIDAAQVMIDGVEHSPRLRIEKSEGFLQVIAEVSLPDYLMGVLHKEMPGTWPMEALKSQVIAARSYTLAQMKAREGENFDLEGNVLDQDFQWVTSTMKKKEIYQRWSQALRATGSYVLVNQKSEILKAYYHADCGGATTVPSLVWGPGEEFQSVVDPKCSQRPQGRWTAEIKKSELVEKLGGALEKMSDFKVDWISTGFDRRITWVEWTLGAIEVGAARMVSGQNFRQLLGFERIKSTRFVTADRGSVLKFTGQGFGHGVGLCQWGARDWAEQGWNVWKILQHYYPKAKIARHDSSWLVKPNSSPQRLLDANSLGSPGDSKQHRR